MYLLDVTVQSALEWAALSTETANTWQDWHCQFSHIGVSGLQCTLSKRLVTGMMVNDTDLPKFNCTACAQTKLARALFLCQSESRAKRLGDLTHTDLWECCVTGIHSTRYFISFIDDHSRCTAIEFLWTKDQAAKKFRNYVAYLERQYNMCPKRFHTDNGGEYITGDLQRWCASKGIKLEYSTTLTCTEWHGRTDEIRTLAELARAMIFSTQVPKFLWPKAIVHATYLHNRMHTRAFESKTPLEAWSRHKLDVLHLREFGSPVWILNKGQLTKLQPKSTKHTFMGFMDGPKAIKYYDAATRQVRVSHNFHFPVISTPQTQPNISATLPQNSAQSEGESVPIGTESESKHVTHPDESNDDRRKRIRTTEKTTKCLGGCSLR